MHKMLCPTRPGFEMEAAGSRTEYQTNDDDCQLIFVKPSQAAPTAASSDPRVVQFYNFTDFTAEVEVPDQQTRVTLPVVGSVRYHPYRYTSTRVTVDAGSECIVRFVVGDYPPTSYVANGDTGQVVFLERVILPEEQEFEATVNSRLEAPLEMLAEWEKTRGKHRRLTTLGHFRQAEEFFREQVSILETAIGQQRASEIVKRVKTKLDLATTALETAHDFTGLKNQAATCYMNSLLQALYMTPELRLALYRWHWDAARGESTEDSIPYQLQKLFCLLQNAETKTVETRQLTASFGWTAADAFVQKDVNDFFLVLCDSLENNFRGTAGAGVIKSLFFGRQNEFLRCETCGFESSHETEFNAINLPVKQHGDPHAIISIEEGLDNYYKSERLCGDNQWYCERCKTKVDAEKGVALSKVPYLLAVNMQRFIFDWTIDQAVKLNDKVSFPETLDVARYLDETPAPSDGAAGGAAGAASADEPGRSDFGKDGSSILMRGRSAVGLEAPNVLNYDLYAILVHAGQAAGGHYYAYIRDFEKNQWFKFNDAEVTGPLDSSEWQQAFGGGYTYNTLGYEVQGGTAYMLMYRRREPAVNIDTVTDALIPQQVLADIAREEAEARDAALAKEAEEERRRDAVPFAVCNQDQMKILWVKEMLSWDEALRQVHQELNLDDSIENIRLLRLEPVQSLDGLLRETSGTTPVAFECDGHTLVKDVRYLRGSICQIDVKAPGEIWADAPPTSQTDTAYVHYSEVGDFDITRHLVCDVGTSFKALVEQISDALHISENEAVQLYTGKTNDRVSGLALRKQLGRYGALTPQWMNEALRDAIGPGAAERLCEMVKSQDVDDLMRSGTIFFVNCSGHPIRIARKDMEYNYNLRCNVQVSRTLETLGGRSSSDSVAAMFHTPAYRGDTYEISCYSIHFEDVHYCNDYDVHQVVIITDEVQIMDARTLLHFKIGPRPKVTSVATVTTGPRALPVYRFHGQQDDLSEFLFEVEVDAKALDDMSVLDFKEIVAVKMADTEGLGVVPPENLRLCELGGPAFCVLPVHR